MFTAKFNNLFYASDENPIVKMRRLSISPVPESMNLTIDPECDYSLPGFNGRSFIKNCLSTTIEGAMVLATRRLGLVLSDVRYIYQVIDRDLDGVMYDMADNPELAMLNTVNLDITDRISMFAPIPANEIKAYAYSLSIDCMLPVLKTPITICPTVIAYPSETMNLGSYEPEIMYRGDTHSMPMPYFSVRLERYPEWVYQTCRRFVHPVTPEMHRYSPELYSYKCPNETKQP